jgi:hypothetical protein
MSGWAFTMALIPSRIDAWSSTTSTRILPVFESTRQFIAEAMDCVSLDRATTH